MRFSCLALPISTFYFKEAFFFLSSPCAINQFDQITAIIVHQLLIT